MLAITPQMRILVAVGVNILAHVQTMAKLFRHSFAFDAELIHE